MKQITVDSPISELSGVGETRKQAFSRMNIFTARDLLYCFPRSYEHRGDIKKLGQGIDSMPHAYMLSVRTVPRTVKTRNGMMLTTFRASDDTGSVEIVFFNQPYVASQIAANSLYRFWGELKLRSGKLILSSPKFDAFHPGSPLPDYVPVYPMTESLSPKVMEKLVKEALSQALPTLNDFLPENIRLKNSLPVLSKAMLDVHRPGDEEALSSAIRRLMFDDFFCFALGVAKSKSEHENVKTVPCRPVSQAPLLGMLPYSLTNAQKRCIDEIYFDMTRKNSDGECPSMRRVLVGDVGSGKTVCAAAAVYLALANGHQAAMMVPTEILAYQHYADLEPLFRELGYTVRLLTGSTSQKEKKEIYSLLASDSDSRIDLVIGTHALLSRRVEFSDLILTVTDEQHRFGILQRAALKEKSSQSHLLVMSATPIPRTLALTIYGDLSVSRIDELPLGRQRVSTYLVDSSYRERMYGFLRRRVSDGGQVYIVCPSVEGHEDGDESTENGAVQMEDLFSVAKESVPKLINAVDYVRELREKVFPDLRVSMIHGQMKSAEKDDIMKRFSKGEIDILVSTTVIEVGVNVPNATVMVVENAERFGLSQLHQLRGRVGRGKTKSYCILVSDSKSETAAMRLQTLCECHDGYLIAERDLAMRGPGDFFASAEEHSVRQSGGLALKMGKYCHDAALMNTAFEAARELMKTDPTLSLPENQALLKEVSRIFLLDETTVS